TPFRMIYSLLLLLLSVLLVRSVDVSTSVFCKSECKAYIETPDALIPYCDDAFMKASTSCGTVISCDLSDANKERIPRAQANSSCCVHTVIVRIPDQGYHISQDRELVRTDKTEQFPICSSSSWMLWTIAVLSCILLLQSSYIAFLFFKCRQSSAQKISQWFGRHSDVASTQPILLARPLIQP
ncbi:hypothetical protein PENTCL1PPCAC_5681, partial [Pristionchus entomophagus]